MAPFCNTIRSCQKGPQSFRNKYIVSKKKFSIANTLSVENFSHKIIQTFTSSEIMQSFILTEMS